MPAISPAILNRKENPHCSSKLKEEWKSLSLPTEVMHHPELLTAASLLLVFIQY